MSEKTLHSYAYINALFNTHFRSSDDNITRFLEDYLKKYLSNANTELEVRFGNNKISDKGPIFIPSVSQYTFKSVLMYLKRLTKNKTFRETNNKSMDITFNGNRLSITDDELLLRQICSVRVEEYNKLTERLITSDNVTFVKKNKINNIIINNLDIKFGLSSEIPLEKERDVLKQFVNKNNIKLFRYKNRVSYIFKDTFRIDLTVVKSINGNDISRVFKENEKYEIEIEALNHSAESNYNDYINELFKLTSFILRIIQKSPIVVSKSITTSILGDIHTTTSINTSKWFGADAVSMSWKNLLEYGNSMKDMKYAVTEKADGDRYMMYVSFEETESPQVKKSKKSKKEYKLCDLILIDRNLNIRIFVKNGSEKNDQKSMNITPNSYYVLDGELIEKNKPIFMVFDILYAKTDVRKNVLIDRIKHFDIFNKIYYGEKKDKKIDRPINIVLKKHHHIVNDSKKSTITMWGNNGLIQTAWNYRLECEYYVDGLIFTPLNEGYPVIDRGKTTWNALLKWKPESLNSVDFRINLRQDYQHIDIKIDGIVEKVNKAYLQVAKNIRGKYQSLNYIHHNKPLDIAIKLDENNSMYAIYPLTKKKEIFGNNSIVEFIYNKNEKSPSLRWVPIRVRNDKEHPNNIFIAKNIMDTMFNPIAEDEHMMKADVDIPTMPIEKEEDGKRPVSRGLSPRSPQPQPQPGYYIADEGEREESKIINFRQGGNAVKRNIIENIKVSYRDKPKIIEYILDLACGRGGDLNKFLSVENKGISKHKLHILGIDIDINGIREARERLSKSQLYKRRIRNSTKTNMSVSYVNGDISKSILNGDTCISDIPNCQSNIVEFRSLSEKVDLVTCMFAAHYMFENIDKLTGFFSNIQDMLKMNGRFIMTCLDGSKLRRKLHDKKFNDSIGIDGKWDITKKYDNIKHPLGNKIIYTSETIHRSEEYLVIEEYLVDIAMQYGFRLEHHQDINEFTDVLNNIHSKNHLIEKMKKESTFELFDMQRAYIFTKNSEFNTTEITERLKHQMSQILSEAAELPSSAVAEPPTSPRQEAAGPPSSAVVEPPSSVVEPPTSPLHEAADSPSSAVVGPPNIVDRIFNKLNKLMQKYDEESYLRELNEENYWYLFPNPFETDANNRITTSEQYSNIFTRSYEYNSKEIPYIDVVQKIIDRYNIKNKDDLIIPKLCIIYGLIKIYETINNIKEVHADTKKQVFSTMVELFNKLVPHQKSSIELISYLNEDIEQQQQKFNVKRLLRMVKNIQKSRKDKKSNK
jgi:hypothetical protein